ncbi:MAG: PKD domain-containing protein [Flavobacteriales bacterium]
MKNNLKITSNSLKRMPLFVLMLSFLFISFSSVATHIVGGEIFYSKLAGDSYEITLIVYRDCGPDNTLGTGFDDIALVGVYNNGNLLNELNLSLSDAEISFVPISLENPCFILPPDLCIQQVVYRTTLNLTPIFGGYDLVYQRCCRNESIANLVNPGDTGMTMWATIPGSETNAEGINNSATFNNTPPVAMCLGGEFFFDHSATDIDGDLLSYELCTPFFGGDPDNPAPNPPAPPFNEILWGPGYSNEIQVASEPNFQIDPVTGQMTGTPTQLGRYAVGICVSEYRNGQLINTTMRDFQYQVTSCDPNIIAAIPNQTQFCDGLSFQFENESFNASSFFWDFGDPNSSQDTSSINSPFYAYSVEGEYEVTLIANPTWPCADTTSNFYNAYPPLEAIIESVIFECNNGSPEYTFTGSDNYDPGAEFVWSFTPEFDSEIFNNSELTQDAPEAGDYVLSYSVTENDCDASETYNLSVPPEPEAILSSQTLFCDGFTFDFENESTNGELFSWDFGVIGSDNDVSGVFEPSFTYPDSGDYTVNLEVFSQNTCPDAVSSTYSIQGLLDPFFTSPDPQCFNGHSFDFQASGFDSQNPTIDWDFGLNASPTGSNQPAVNNVTWSSPGNYQVDLAISENNCTKVISQNISIVANPIPDFFLFGDEGCPPLTVNFFNASESEVPLMYTWDFGDGQSSEEVNPTHQYSAPGVYDVSLVVTSSTGCSDEVNVSYQDIINVYPTPTAGFESDLYTVSYLEPTVNITNTSTGETSCFYDFGDGAFTTDCNPTHDFEDVGFLEVVQTVTNNFGCFDIATVMITVEGHLFYAPNTFTPNNDGLNEIFKPLAVGVSKYEFRIFNRWGEVIFETEDHNEGWNGSVNRGSSYAPNGTYTYQVIVNDFTGYPHEYNGHVTLTR